MSDKGLRYNQGKNRLSLVPTSAIEGIGEVLTYGANKYTVRDEQGNVLVDGSNNWRKGLPWGEVLDSLKRHLAAFEKGEDYDIESNCMHIDHLLTNAAFLKEFYKVYPQGDNRLHAYLNRKKIGLDIDDTLNTFIEFWCETHNCPIPNHWDFDREIRSKLNDVDKEFWMNIPVKVQPKDIPFTPTCFITARSIPEDWTREWLDKNDFPHVPLYSVGIGQSKLEVCKKENLDYFVDDNFDTFVELNKNGICTFLMDALHNKKHEVGYKRVQNLTDFSKKVGITL